MKEIQSNCVYLRTKMSYLPIPGDEDSWRRGESSSASYWCLKTMIPIGPDDHYVAPETCQCLRGCYVEKIQV